jgi:deoxycytidine triphosphate deaminase
VAAVGRGCLGVPARNVVSLQHLLFAQQTLICAEWRYTMLLSKDQIRQKGLIVGADQKRYENASYDMTVGCIITPQGEAVDFFSLPPQGIVRVISSETVTLPADVAGFALVKTTLCNEGVLALNIGVIDPLYKGPVSSALINFGKEARVVSKGQVFLRLTFFQYEPAQEPEEKAQVSREQATIEDRKRSLQIFGSTFLDIENTTKKVASRAFDSYRKAFLVYVPLAAVFIAVLTFLLNFSSLSLMQRFIQPVDSAKVLQLQETVSQQQKDIEALKRRNEELQKELDAKPGKSKIPATQ